MRGLILLFIMIFLACGRESEDPSLKFTASVNNPVLNPGIPGEWDDMSVQVPYVVAVEGTLYLFFTGFSSDGPPAIGIATSGDGVHFTKLKENPVFAADGTGIDAYGVGAQVIIKGKEGWVMYYNARDISGYGPGSYIGRATADELAGPWYRTETPVLVTGKTGDWDAGFVFPTSVLINDDGLYMMYYSGGTGFDFDSKNYIGLATSADGITWKKYNNPATAGHPYAESDPVLMSGKSGDWDGFETWSCYVFRNEDGFVAVYSGGPHLEGGQTLAAGYATSNNGIQWTKYGGNPVFEAGDDPFGNAQDGNAIIEFPVLVVTDTAWLLYYDYGSIVGKIGLAVSKINEPGR